MEGKGKKKVEICARVVNPQRHEKKNNSHFLPFQHTERNVAHKDTAMAVINGRCASCVHSNMLAHKLGSIASWEKNANRSYYKRKGRKMA